MEQDSQSIIPETQLPCHERDVLDTPDPSALSNQDAQTPSRHKRPIYTPTATPSKRRGACRVLSEGEPNVSNNVKPAPGSEKRREHQNFEGERKYTYSQTSL